ncbi:MAG TPA: RidA family protein [Gemmatimonadaceae bacterium]|nr:RidA family protein [Gemmatimonadaceae bacterium]
MRSFVLLLVLAIAAPACAQGPVVEFRPGTGNVGPFSEAVRVDGLLFLSGMIGNDSTGALVRGGIGPETRQTLENIRSALARNGVGMDRVVKCTVFLADIAEWPAMNEVYRTYFPQNKPARSALGGASLVRNARVEIECIAAAR